MGVQLYRHYDKDGVLLYVGISLEKSAARGNSAKFVNRYQKKVDALANASTFENASLSVLIERSERKFRSEAIAAERSGNSRTQSPSVPRFEAKSFAAKIGFPR